MLIMTANLNSKQSTKNYTAKFLTFQYDTSWITTSGDKNAAITSNNLLEIDLLHRHLKWNHCQDHRSEIPKKKTINNIYCTNSSVDHDSRTEHDNTNQFMWIDIHLP